jgi:hypothetical protein
MNFRPAVFLLLLLAATHAVFAADDVVKQNESPGFFKRTITRINPFHHDAKPADADDGKKKHGAQTDLTIRISPSPLKLSDTHQMEVAIVLSNRSKSTLQLAFETSQRFEVLLRNDAGKVINQWSENQAFTDDPAYLTLNAHESVEYSASISGRDMAVGKKYTVEAFIVGHKEFSATKTIVPER